VDVSAHASGAKYEQPLLRDQGAVGVHDSSCSYEHQYRQILP
jgi:hypothetical protein